MLSHEFCEDIKQDCIAAFGGRAHAGPIGKKGRQCFRVRRGDEQLCAVYLDERFLSPGRVIEFFLSDKQPLGALSSPAKVADWMKHEADKTGRGAKSRHRRKDQAFPGLYFTDVEQFREFISRVGALAKGLPDPGAGVATGDRFDSKAELEKLKRLSRRATECPGAVDLRRGQRELKRYLLLAYGKCMVTGVRTHDLLVCSHIKGWADAPGLRLDPDNALLLTAGMDRLFDKGLIAFDDEGRLLIDDQLDTNERKRLHLVKGLCLSITLSDKRKLFLRLHRREHGFETAPPVLRRRRSDVR